MCVDLASTHLKAYFTQLHYFGRARKFLDMGDDIRNMMEYLAWMRKKKGGNVTWQDVADLLEQIKRGPYDPSVAMRFIDETSSQVSTMRQNSCSDMCGSKGNLSASRRQSMMRNSRDLTPFAEDVDEMHLMPPNGPLHPLHGGALTTTTYRQALQPTQL
jgi:hypothetical protein